MVIDWDIKRLSWLTEDVKRGRVLIDYYAHRVRGNEIKHAKLCLTFELVKAEGFVDEARLRRITQLEYEHELLCQSLESSRAFLNGRRAKLDALVLKLNLHSDPS